MLLLTTNINGDSCKQNTKKNKNNNNKNVTKERVKTWRRAPFSFLFSLHCVLLSSLFCFLCWYASFSLPLPFLSLFHPETQDSEILMTTHHFWTSLSLSKSEPLLFRLSFLCSLRYFSFLFCHWLCVCFQKLHNNIPKIAIATSLSLPHSLLFSYISFSDLLPPFLHFGPLGV